MIFGHFYFVAKYTNYCKNGHNGKSAIKLIKINIVILFKSLHYIILKVEENKVPLEFWFCCTFGFSSKKPKNYLKWTFYKENANSEDAFT